MRRASGVVAVMAQRTRLTQLAAALAVALLLVLAAAARAGNATSTETSGLRLPPPTGTHPIGTTTLALVDRGRRDPLAPSSTDRRLLVQLWYPTVVRRGPHAAYASPQIAALLQNVFKLPNGTFLFKTAATLDAPPAAGRHPLLLLSHGLGTLPEFSSALAGDLASRGYLVAAIAHTYDAAAVA